ncbi:MAG TPA: alanine racemase [Salinimicrobium sp.]|nr:alanine racemase [Salinimicrobium sp.]
MGKAQETVLEINLNALAHNFRHLKSQVGNEVKFMAVVKAFGYGSDIVGISKKLTELGADYLAVAYTSEGIALRKAGIRLPILVFHPQIVHFESLIEHCLEPGIYSELVLDNFITTAQKLKQSSYPVHLKFNTGLNRLGFAESLAKKIARRCKTTPAIEVVSLYSHLAASADWREREFTLNQIHSFKQLSGEYYKETGASPLLHICNTSGILNYPEAALDMVRAGIGLYGFGNDKDHDKKLRPVGTLKTVISQIQNLKAGDTVGYNRSFKATKPTRIAVLPLGYNDGISRIYGNQRAGVFIGDVFAPIVGDVCMDMIMVDVTGINCEETDEVIIFGGPQHATNFAGAGDTISYELITGISQRVRRKLTEN